MHDTFLLKKISDSLEQICRDKEINKITKVNITVNLNSHVTQETLMLELRDSIPDFIDENLLLEVQRKNIGELTAYINDIAGERWKKLMK